MAPLRSERTVWVVDDSPADARRAREALDPDYRVLAFGDGATVLERLADRGAPDVLVLDWLMPAVSGLDVCRFLRSARSPAPHAAILLLTVFQEPQQVVEGLAAGANDFLAKPYAPEELRARVANLLRQSDLIDRLTRAEEQVRRLLASAPDAILAADEHGVVNYANQEAEHVFGVAAEALVGCRLTELLPAFELGWLGSSSGPAVIPLPDLRIGTQLFAPTARRMPSDFAAHVTIALRNMTERSRVEARRLDFYSIIAHDLRSPLHSMLLRTDLLLEGQRGTMPVGAIADLRRMQSNIRTMVALVNDFLDLARLEGTGFKLAREPVDLRTLIEQTVEDIRPLVQESQLRLESELEDFDAQLEGDRRRLMQVVSNLLSNAVKFTPPGGCIAVSVRQRGQQAEVSVSDTGPGIPEDQLATLFQRYSRPAGSGHVVGGTGLGLMIVREIVEAHGGQVGVDSTPGQGSRFWFRLPRRSWAEAQPGADGAQTVLIVDDDRDLRETLRFMVEAQGYRVVEAENGQQGLDAMNRQHPCAVLLNLTMPIMDGWQFVDRVRRDQRHAAVPICVVSGMAQQAPPAVSRALQKPIPVAEVLSFLRTYCPLRAGESPGPG